MKVVPAILANSYEELAYYLNKVKDISDLIHIDVADGELVGSKTVGPEALRELDPQVDMEVHLMVKNPIDWISWYDLDRVKKLIFHFESFDDAKSTIDKIRETKLAPILTINPETRLELIYPFVEKVEGIQLMTVHPGKQGNDFKPEVLPKIKYLKDKFPELPVSIDGGVSLENFTRVLEQSLDEVVIGSAIVKADHPQAALEHFEKLARSQAL